MRIKKIIEEDGKCRLEGTLNTRLSIDYVFVRI
jgi:hypothetical protein